MLKYTIKVDKENIVDNVINIPLGQLFYPNSDQYFLSENKIDLDTKSVINSTIDYEKVKIHPVVSGGTYNDVTSIQFNLNFYINNNWTTETTSLSQIGFDEDDVINRRQQLEKTFLRLSFYDSDDLKAQNLLFFSTIFVDSGKLYSEFITGSTIAELKMRFNINNPKLTSEIKSFEGFYIYLFSDDVPKNKIKTIYMKVEYNSALNGKTSLFLKNRSDTNYGFALNELKNNMFLPISVEYNTILNKYVYWFNDHNAQNTDITLYQAKVI